MRVQMRDRLHVQAPSKLNLTLSVGGPDADRMHPIADPKELLLHVAKAMQLARRCYSRPFDGNAEGYAPAVEALAPPTIPERSFMPSSNAGIGGGGGSSLSQVHGCGPDSDEEKMMGELERERARVVERRRRRLTEDAGEGERRETAEKADCVVCVSCALV